MTIDPTTLKLLFISGGSLFLHIAIKLVMLLINGSRVHYSRASMASQVSNIAMAFGT
jgi:hypothetical protein